MSYAQNLAKAARERRIRMSVLPLGLSMSGTATGRLQDVGRSLGMGTRRIPTKEIIAAVAQAHKVEVDDILGHGRSRFLICARHHAITQCIELRPDLSLSHIGRIFNRDHSTIIHARDSWAKKNGVMRPAQRRAVYAILFKDAEPMVG